MIKSLTSVLVGLLLLGLVGLFVVDVRYNPDPRLLGLEIAKSFLQMIVVLVFGTILSLLSAEFNRARAERERRRDTEHRKAENRDEFRKELLDRLNRAYINTKRARRLLRARAFSPPYYGTLDPTASVLAEPYDEQMSAINDIQLDLELLAKDVESNPGAFSDSERVLKGVAGMEKILNGLVTEYEQQRGYFTGSPVTREVSKLKMLADLVSPRDQSHFGNGFAAHFKEVSHSIREDLVAGDSHAILRGERVLNNPK